MPKITPFMKPGPNGKPVQAYKIRYLDKGAISPKTGKPVHRQEIFDKRKHAEARLLVISNEIASGTHIARAAAKTVSEIAEMYIRNMEDKRRDGRIGESRFSDLKRDVDMYISPMLGRRLFDELTVIDIERFYSECMRVRRIMPTTARRKVYALSQIQEYAVRRGLVKSRIVTDALKELRGIQPTKIKTFSPQEIATLLREASRRAHCMRHRTQCLVEVFVNVAAFCGLRLGEIAGLTRSSIDFDKRLLFVRHSMTAWGELKGPKTRAGVRDVPMPNHVAALLRRWCVEFFKENDRDLLFPPREAGSGMSYGSFHSAFWKPLLKRSGLQSPGDAYHFHALRHFAASWMIENGMSVVDVAQILGHSKFDMTLQTYAHPIVNGDRRHTAFEKMASSLISAPLTIDAEAQAA